MTYGIVLRDFSEETVIFWPLILDLLTSKLATTGFESAVCIGMMLLKIGIKIPTSRA